MGLEQAIEQAKCFAKLMSDKTVERVEENFDILFIPFMVGTTLFIAMLFKVLFELVGVSIYVYM